MSEHHPSFYIYIEEGYLSPISSDEEDNETSPNKEEKTLETDDFYVDFTDFEETTNSESVDFSRYESESTDSDEFSENEHHEATDSDEFSESDHSDSYIDSESEDEELVTINRFSSTITKEDFQYFGDNQKWLSQTLHKGSHIYGVIPGQSVFSVFNDTKTIIAICIMHNSIQNGKRARLPLCSVIVKKIQYDFGDIVIFEWDGDDIAKFNLALNKKQKVPVRVFRSSESNSEYAPESGYRFDGLYWVTGDWIEKKSGKHIFRLVRFQGLPPIPKRKAISKELSSKNQKRKVEQILEGRENGEDSPKKKLKQAVDKNLNTKKQVQPKPPKKIIDPQQRELIVNHFKKLERERELQRMRASQASSIWRTPSPNRSCIPDKNSKQKTPKKKVRWSPQLTQVKLYEVDPKYLKTSVYFAHQNQCSRFDAYRHKGSPGNAFLVSSKSTRSSIPHQTRETTQSIQSQKRDHQRTHQIHKNYNSRPKSYQSNSVQTYSPSIYNSSQSNTVQSNQQTINNISLPEEDINILKKLVQHPELCAQIIDLLKADPPTIVIDDSDDEQTIDLNSSN